MAPAARPTGLTTGLTPADYRAYGGLLADVHAACNAQDLDALGELATPEMVEHFGDRFASDVYDVVTGVRLRRMRPVRVWPEDGPDHATIAMRYSMTAVVCDGYGRVLHGAGAGRVTVEESWTFVRRGRWLLTAIQPASGTRDRVARGTPAARGVVRSAP